MAGRSIGSLVAGFACVMLASGPGQVLLAPPAGAQVISVPTTTGQYGGSPGTTVATPFRWNQTSSFNPRGVQIPVGPLSDWLYIPPGVLFRQIPSLTPDPIIEVILMPPLSGHPTKNERFKLQWPLAAKSQWSESRALVIAFHPFNVSELSPFVKSDLPYVCHDKGWILLAPLGLSQANFGNVNAQRSLDAVLNFLEPLLTWNRKRVYAVGFSMGGGAAVSWSMRHQSPDRPRVAAVVDHTGTMDLIAEYDSQSELVQSVMESDWHFGGTPTEKPFEYERVSPFLYDGAAVDDANASVLNLVPHTPFYLHWNEADPNTDLVQATVDLRNYLQLHGATVEQDIVNAPGVHAWSTLDVAEALDWCEGFKLDSDDPTGIEMYADRRAKYLFSELLSGNATSLSHYEVDVTPGSNHFQFIGVDNIGTIGFDLDRMKLDASSPMTIAAFSQDFSTDTLVLQGYPALPASVVGSPAVNWSYNAIRDELTISTTMTGGTSITVTP